VHGAKGDKKDMSMQPDKASITPTPKIRPLVLTLQRTKQLFGAHRRLWIPFLAVAIVEIMLIVLVWLSPHPPFSAVLAPPINFFFGNQVLHYPVHLWFIYHAMKHTHLVASVIIGAFMTGIACAMVKQANDNTRISLREVLVSKQVRYGTVLLLWLTTWGLAKAITKSVSQIEPRIGFVIAGMVIVLFILQALFVYAIPASVFEGKGWWGSLRRSVEETIRYPVTTLIVVGMPVLVLVLFSMLLGTSQLAHLMRATTPEIVFPIVALRLVVWTVADAVMTVAIAHLWLIHRAGESASTAKLTSAVSERSLPASQTGTSSPDIQQHINGITEGPAVA